VSARYVPGKRGADSPAEGVLKPREQAFFCELSGSRRGASKVSISVVQERMPADAAFSFSLTLLFCFLVGSLGLLFNKTLCLVIALVLLIEPAKVLGSINQNPAPAFNDAAVETVHIAVRKPAKRRG
jgi:hypothetical protein